MLENQIQIVSYTISSVILVLSGDSIVKDLVIPFIKNIIKDTPPLLSVLIGTILFIAWCYFGALLIGKLILNTNLINKDNIDAVAIISFIVLAVILNVKYQMGW